MYIYTFEKISYESALKFPFSLFCRYDYNDQFLQEFYDMFNLFVTEGGMAMPEVRYRILIYNPCGKVINRCLQKKCLYIGRNYFPLKVDLQL